MCGKYLAKLSLRGSGGRMQDPCLPFHGLQHLVYIARLATLTPGSGGEREH